jgi:microcystin-dependent protein
MSSPFLAEIRIFGFNFPPKGWAFCNGQILPISQNTALFSLLGTTYGGNGQSTFALPDMQGNAPMHQGQGPGLSLYDLGQMGGAENVTLLQSEMPAHPHTLMAFGNPPPSNAGAPDPTATFGRSSGTTVYKQTPFGAVGAMDFNALAPTGGSLPHNNMMPYLTLSFCIAMQGIFPARP